MMQSEGATGNWLRVPEAWHFKGLDTQAYPGVFFSLVIFPICFLFPYSLFPLRSDQGRHASGNSKWRLPVVLVFLMDGSEKEIGYAVRPVDHADLKTFVGGQKQWKRQVADGAVSLVCLLCA